MSPKEECEVLLQSAVPLAIEQLEKRGGFRPFGFTLNPAMQVAPAAPLEGGKQPDGQHGVDFLLSAYRHSAMAGKVRATALVHDGRVVDPSTGSKSDAIVVYLDHQASYSVRVFFPYSLKAGAVEIGSAWAEPGQDLVFSKQ